VHAHHHTVFYSCTLRAQSSGCGANAVASDFGSGVRGLDLIEACGLVFGV
jgi:hypothetical protein